LRDDLVLLPEVLQRRGYETIAQSANPWVDRRYGLARGFGTFRLYNTDDERILYDLMKLATRLAPWQMFLLREYLPPYAKAPIRALADDATEILRTRDDSRPLFLYVQPIDPHGPYQPPPGYVEALGATLTRSDYVSYWVLGAGVTVSARQ